MPTPEIPLDQKIQEHSETFSEKVTSLGVQPVPTNVTPVVNNQNQPLVTTPTQSAKIQLPGDKVSLLAKSKGKIGDAATWLARFLLRMLAIKEDNADTGNN